MPPMPSRQANTSKTTTIGAVEKPKDKIGTDLFDSNRKEMAGYS